MANNTANLRSRVLGSRDSGTSQQQQTEELANSAGEANPQSRDNFANRPFFSVEEYDRHEPPKDRMRRYWRQFETTPLIREPITSFARQVVEPGYRVEADGILDEEQVEEIERWLQNCAIVNTRTDADVRKLLKKAAIQREVRGTALIEKVPAREDDDTLYGVKLINPETVDVNTMPGQAMLLPPKPPEELFGDWENVEPQDVPVTDDGLAAAYQQDVMTTRSRWLKRRDNQNKDSDLHVYWTREELIPLTRDADVGEAFGTSRLEAVSDRIEGLKKKLQDNDEAIASKAYPLWLFMFGTDDQPWDRDDINRFMSAHDMENFQPGLKQGVRGDVDVKTISGEVADIAEYLQFDLDYILTSMPMPKYTLGAFESQINQFVSQSQERDIQRQLKEARREMESEFSEVVQEKAQEKFGLSDEEARDVEFKMGIPNEQGQQNDPSSININYQGVGNGDQQNNQQQQQQQQQQNPQSGGSGNEDGGSDGQQQDEEQNLMDVDVSELADPRFTNTSDEHRVLTSAIDTVFANFTEGVLGELRGQYRDAPQNAQSQLNSLLARQQRLALDRSEYRGVTNDAMENVVRKALRTLSDDTSLDFDTVFNFTHRRSVDGFVNNVEQSVRRALDDFAARMETQFNRGANNGEEMETIVQRMQNTFNEDALHERARIIAQMEVQNAVESTKLAEYEKHDDVIGVKPISTCGPGTTPLCEDLAGCGGEEAAVAYFDREQSLSEQWDAQTNDRHKFDGFDPLPSNPPWHFGCSTELVPVTEGDELTHEPEQGEVYSIEQLEDKYGIEVTE